MLSHVWSAFAKSSAAPRTSPQRTLALGALIALEVAKALVSALALRVALGIEATPSALKGIDHRDQRDSNEHCQQQQRQSYLDVVTEDVAARFHHQHIHRG